MKKLFIISVIFAITGNLHSEVVMPKSFKRQEAQTQRLKNEFSEFKKYPYAETYLAELISHLGYQIVDFLSEDYRNMILHLTSMLYSKTTTYQMLCDQIYNFAKIGKAIKIQSFAMRDDK